MSFIDEINCGATPQIIGTQPSCDPNEDQPTGEIRPKIRIMRRDDVIFKKSSDGHSNATYESISAVVTDAKPIYEAFVRDSVYSTTTAFTKSGKKMYKQELGFILDSYNNQAKDFVYNLGHNKAICIGENIPNSNAKFEVYGAMAGLELADEVIRATNDDNTSGALQIKLVTPEGKGEQYITSSYVGIVDALGDIDRTAILADFELLTTNNVITQAINIVKSNNSPMPTTLGNFENKII